MSQCVDHRTILAIVGLNASGVAAARHVGDQPDPTATYF